MIFGIFPLLCILVGVAVILVVLTAVIVSKTTKYNMMKIVRHRQMRLGLAILVFLGLLVALRPLWHPEPDRESGPLIWQRSMREVAFLPICGFALGLVIVGLYLLAGRRPVPSPHIIWQIIAYSFGVIYLLVDLSFLNYLAWEVSHSSDNEGKAIAISSLSLGSLYCVAMVAYIFWRPRLLLGWCLGSLVGIYLLHLVVSSWSYSSDWTGVGLGAVLIFVTPAVFFIIGPLLGLPFAWIWQWRAGRRMSPGQKPNG